MNGEFVNVLLVLAFLVAGTAIVALLVAGVLKRFGCRGEASPKIDAPKSKERHSRKADSVSTPRPDN